MSGMRSRMKKIKRLLKSELEKELEDYKEEINGRIQRNEKDIADLEDRVKNLEKQD